MASRHFSAMLARNNWTIETKNCQQSELLVLSANFDIKSENAL